MGTSLRDIESSKKSSIIQKIRKYDTKRISVSTSRYRETHLLRVSLRHIFSSQSSGVPGMVSLLYLLASGSSRVLVLADGMSRSFERCTPLLLASRALSGSGRFSMDPLRK